jgi:hypothetical protein
MQNENRKGPDSRWISAVRADFLCVIDLLVAVDCFFQIKIAPVSGAFQIPVQQEPVQFFHVAVQCGNTVFPAEPDPQGNAGRFEGGIDQRQNAVSTNQ